MAKAKTKDGPLSTKLTMEEPGVWTWEDSGRKWYWLDRVGMNSGVINEAGVMQPQMYFPSIKDAVYYWAGFGAGVSYAERKKT